MSCNELKLKAVLFTEVITWLFFTRLSLCSILLSKMTWNTFASLSTNSSRKFILKKFSWICWTRGWQEARSLSWSDPGETRCSRPCADGSSSGQQPRQEAREASRHVIKTSAGNAHFQDVIRLLRPRLGPHVWTCRPRRLCHEWYFRTRSCELTKGQPAISPSSSWHCVELHYINLHLLFTMKYVSYWLSRKSYLVIKRQKTNKLNNQNHHCFSKLQIS